MSVCNQAVSNLPGLQDSNLAIARLLRYAWPHP